MKTLNSHPPIFIIFSLLACVLLCGCLPYRFTGRPGTTGVVLDSSTRAPIAGATVTVASRQRYNNEMRGNAVTAADGSFHIPPQPNWGILLPFSDTYPSPISLSVQHAGYQETYIEFPFLPIGPINATNVGQIPLQRE